MRTGKTIAKQDLRRAAAIDHGDSDLKAGGAAGVQRGLCGLERGFRRVVVFAPDDQPISAALEDKVIRVRFSMSADHALETAVFNELSRRGAQVAYVNTRDGYEVDFLAQHPDGRLELVQVCADVTDPANWHRESDETPQDACAARAPVAVGRRLSIAAYPRDQASAR